MELNKDTFLCRKGVFELHATREGKFLGYRLTFSIPAEAIHLFMDSGYAVIIGNKAMYIRSFNPSQYDMMQHIILGITAEVDKWKANKAQLKADNSIARLAAYNFDVNDLLDNTLND